jgi:hypothetical protein
MMNDKMIKMMAKSLACISKCGCLLTPEFPCDWCREAAREAFDAIKPAINRQIAEARDKALEDAAAIVDRSVCAACRTNNVLANEIKALKS